MVAAFGLYTHIQANRRRSFLLIAGLFFLFYLMTFSLFLLLFAFGDDGSSPFPELLFLAAIITLISAPIVSFFVGLWVWYGTRFSTSILGWVTNAGVVDPSGDKSLYRLMENLCISRGMPTPQLRIIETSTPNAFAMGTRPGQYAIVLTRGLLNLLDKTEVEAVLAHELTHIRNGDTRTMIIAVLVVGIMSFVGDGVFRWLGRFSDTSPAAEKSGSARFVAMAVALVLLVVAWQLAVVIRFSLSRKREYIADAGAVELTRNPDAMISALRKIDGKGELESLPSAVMELCLDNPREGFSDLFATHPSIEDRIAALVRYAGGRDARVPTEASDVSSAATA